MQEHVNRNTTKEKLSYHQNKNSNHTLKPENG